MTVSSHKVSSHGKNEDDSKSIPSSQPKLRLLTVGDGDLTLSLALARCYNSSKAGRCHDSDNDSCCDGCCFPIELTASTILESPEQLCATYPNTARQTLAALASFPSVRVLFSVDACRLHDNSSVLQLLAASNDDDDTTRSLRQRYDMVLFHHPHLGNYHKDELVQVNEHRVLLSHYLWSARQIADHVHVALCGSQENSWGLLEAATRVGCLRMIGEKVPIHHRFHTIFPTISNADNYLDWKSSYSGKKTRQVSSKRHGKSNHWLCQFGYQHVRTTARAKGSAAPNLAGSFHYVFRRSKNEKDGSIRRDEDNSVFREGSSSTTSRLEEEITLCSICGVSCRDNIVLQRHMDQPARPVTATTKDAVQLPVEPSIGDARKRPANSSSSPIHAEHSHEKESIVNNQSLRKSGETAYIVDTLCDGKRLRWFLHNVVFHTTKNSKRDCDIFIKSGTVSVNGTIARDTGRILKAGWNVSIHEISRDKAVCQQSQALPTTIIEIVDTWRCPTSSGSVTGRQSHDNSDDKRSNNCFYFVWKPVGMRTIGSFDPSTLEESFSRQQNHARIGKSVDDSTSAPVKFSSLTKLEKGCSGLCLLTPSSFPFDSTNASSELEVTHTFTVLVHGIVPKAWSEKDGVSIRLPLDGVRRWKKRAVEKESEEFMSASKEFSATINCMESTSSSSVSVDIDSDRTKSSTSPPVPPLSTLEISTKSRSSGLVTAISYYLLKTAGHPVVGDRTAVSEYLSLPRAMRNRIKQRFCIGCTRICVRVVRRGSSSDLPHKTASVTTVPDKWRASHWQDFCDRASRGVATKKKNSEAHQPLTS